MSLNIFSSIAKIFNTISDGAEYTNKAMESALKKQSKELAHEEFIHAQELRHEKAKAMVKYRKKLTELNIGSLKQASAELKQVTDEVDQALALFEESNPDSE